MKQRFPLLLTLPVFLCMAFSAGAQVVRSFTPRFTIDTKGSIVLVSNNIITTKFTTGINYLQSPPGCSSVCKNDAKQNTNIDIDNDPSTFNSSSADLIMGSCNSVAFAGLYWGAGIAIGQDANGAHPMKSPNWAQVKLKAPGGNYQTITADVLDSVKTVFEGYQAFADVTDMVRAAGAGSYTVANVKCDTVSITNAYGGWTMVVVYNDPALPLRNLTVFDGLAVIGTTGGGIYSTRDITVSGFKCPPQGVVAAKIGVVVYDGDRGAKDGFFVKSNSTNAFIDQTATGESADALSNSEDCWNSGITANAQVITTRNPAHANTYGYDAHLYTLNNTGNSYLRNGDSSATIRVSTPASSGEGYVLGLMTTEIDTYTPDIIMENTLTNLNGTYYKKEDTVLISSTLRNTGTDTATHATVVTQLAPYFKYVAGSLLVDGISRTDAALDDVAAYDAPSKKITVHIGQGATSVAGGSLPEGNDVYTISYKVTISSACSDVGYASKLLMLQSAVLYTDQSTGVADSTASRPDGGGCLLPIMPDTAFLSMGCDIVLYNTGGNNHSVSPPQERETGQPRFSPNPSHTVALLKGLAGVKKLEWYTTNGRFVKDEFNITTGKLIDVSALTPGLYIVKAYTAKTVVIIKMIKN